SSMLIIIPCTVNAIREYKLPEFLPAVELAYKIQCLESVLLHYHFKEIFDFVKCNLLLDDLKSGDLQ
ncbi:hypothetical protein, partial [Prevotella fusca]